MWIEPWQEEAAYTLRREREYEAWLETKPICYECYEPIGDRELYDFSNGSREEGYTFHKKCVEGFFDSPTGGNLCEVIRCEIINNDKYLVKNNK